MADEHNGADGKPEENQALDYILAFLIFVTSLITGGTPSNQNSEPGENKAHQEIARWTKVVGLWTRWLVIVGVITAAVLAVQTFTLINQFSEMQAEQRPWMTIIGPRPVSPLTWDEKGAHITIAWEVNNVGRGRPAFDVLIETKALVITNKTHGIAAEITSFCSQVRQDRFDKFPQGDIFFPRESLTQRTDLLFPQADISSDMAERKRRVFTPTILICADYQDSSDDNRHATGFAYLIVLKDGKMTLPSPDQGEIQSIDLSIGRLPFGSYAH